ncbi:HlyD family secretion protein [Chitinophaga nivalis]|uniref:HlyD family secretion protein n=1 Tax=Chitinophaga nivalis TaxID=2991709 RepID=A0ABT3IN70_9BACT|nr:HlyD family secretion protein [Chitinophaga nivalis]MCW3464893.1 HlyD family secretion protein [Chitinophaga nivalis]MCW3485416.1 HlyD family secretion protein [Chitinophaga nivalis]
METKTKKTNQKITLLLSVLLLAGTVLGIREYNYYRHHEDTDDAQIDGDISPVVARIGGYVDSILFEENTRVTAGQALVVLDDRDYTVKLEQALAAQKGASQTLGISQAGIQATRAFSSRYKAEAEAARVKLWQATQDYERYQHLVKAGAITRQQYEHAKAAKDAAQAAYLASQEQYLATMEQMKSAQSQLAVTHTGIDQQQAAVDFARLQLTYTRMMAPATGLVSKKFIQQGQLVQAGQQLFSVVHDNSLYVTANFKETQLEHLRPGQPVTIKVDAFPGKPLQGTVYNYAPGTGARFALLPPDNATGNFVKVVQRVPVKIRITDYHQLQSLLCPGMSVKVSVTTTTAL